MTRKHALVKRKNVPRKSGRTPAQRRAELSARMAARGIAPIVDYDGYLEEVTDFWPKNETRDEFLAWLRESRREGK
jgi:hypothetical protein